MTFNSIIFYLFLSIVVLLFYALPTRFRWFHLVLSSYIFYIFIDLRYLGLLIVSTFIDYIIGLLIGSSKKDINRKLFVVLSLVINLSLLFGFKYFTFFYENVITVAQLIWVDLQIIQYDIIAPVGISFITFKKISYIIDVYKGNSNPERHFGYFALYVSHFLEILAGPIDRARHLIPQLKAPSCFMRVDFSSSLILILWGIFLKVVVADRLGLYTDAVFNNVENHSGPSLVLAAYFYSF